MSMQEARRLRSRPAPGRLALAISLAMSLTMVATAPAFGEVDDGLFGLSLEELMNLEVTSVSRKSERLADTTSAVFVVTREDIERHGIRSIPDALRLVPGISALQIDANKWAIGSRGWSGRFSNKLLILMDGRLLYTPSFSGVFWDVQHTMIEEVERIEVVRGPGPAVWGTNAVNGVINIITRSASADDANLVVGGLQPEGGAFAATSRNGKLGTDGSYRAFLQYQDGDGNRGLDGTATSDDWDLVRGGIRSDWRRGNLELSVDAEAYAGDMGQSFVSFIPLPPYQTVSAIDSEVAGAFVSAQWRVDRREGVQDNGQVYLDHTDRESRFLNEERTTFSAELNRQVTSGAHDLVFGALFRYNDYSVPLSGPAFLAETEYDDHVVSVFFQDEITLKPEVFSLTVGGKLESNELSPRDVEFMPTVRFLWQPQEGHSVWGAVTRAIRVPSAIADLTELRTTDIAQPIPPGVPANPFPVPLRTGTIGNPDFVSEEVMSYELGVRGRLSPTLSYDLALFHMEYEEVRSLQPIGVFCSPSGTSVDLDPRCLFESDSVIAQLFFTNEGEGDATGAELSVDWVPTERLRLRGHISYVDEEQSAPPPTAASFSFYPKWQAVLRSEWSISDRMDVALLLRYVDEIAEQETEDYWQANLNLRWRFQDDWVLSLGGRNLLHSGQFEAISEFRDVFPTEIERTAYVNLRYEY